VTRTIPRLSLRFAVLAPFLAASLLLSACAEPGNLTSSSPSDSAGPGGAASQGVVWGACDAELLVDRPSELILSGEFSLACGDVVVPASYDRSDVAADFRIQMMKLTSDESAENKDAIFINPGGPGGSGVEQVQTSEFPKALVEAFDIIGFDPRGVGTSIFTDGQQLSVPTNWTF